MKMDCRQIEELMMDYLYQELDADQTSAYRAHLTTCVSCGAQLAGYERTRLAVRDLPDIEPPAEVTARLLQEAARRPVRALEPVGAAATVGARGVAAAAPVEGKGAWAWLSGWMQPIFAHPGFAAAAGVILVAGIAGLLALRGRLDLSAPRASAPAPATEAATGQGNDTQGALRERSAPQAGFTEGAYDRTAPPVGMAAPAPPPVAPGLAVDPARGVGSARLAEPKAGDGISGYLQLQDKDRREGAVAEERKADKNIAAPTSAPRAAASPPKPADAPAEAEMDSSAGGAGRGAVAKKEARPVTTVIMPHEASRPAKSAAEKPSSPAADDYRGAEDGALGGTLSGSGPEATSAAPPPPPAAAPQVADSAPAPTTKAKSAGATAQENEAKKLHGQARMKANTGNCAAALKLRDRIYRVDPAYFERSVRNDADLGKCSAGKKASESRDAKMPAPAPARDAQPALSK